MALLDRSEWYDLARDTNWTPSFVTREELYPPALSGGEGIPDDAWEGYDEPYKVSFREYVEIQRQQRRRHLLRARRARADAALRQR